MRLVSIVYNAVSLVQVPGIVPATKPMLPCTSNVVRSVNALISGGSVPFRVELSSSSLTIWLLSHVGPKTPRHEPPHGSLRLLLCGDAL